MKERVITVEFTEVEEAETPEEAKTAIKVMGDAIRDEILKVVQDRTFSGKELYCIAQMVKMAVHGGQCGCGACKYAPKDITSCEVDMQVRKRLMDATGVYLGADRKGILKTSDSLAEDVSSKIKDLHHGCW